jgi:hypothetical protein
VMTSTGSSAATASTDAPQWVESRAARAMELNAAARKRVEAIRLF